MYNTRHGIGNFLVLIVMGLVLVGVLACCVLGTSAMAFQTGRSQGYVAGGAYASGEGVRPVPYGYHGPCMGMLSIPLLCGGGLLLLLVIPVLLLPLKVVAFAGRRPRRWHKYCGPGTSWPDEEMPDEVKQWFRQHFEGHSQHVEKAAPQDQDAPAEAE